MLGRLFSNVYQNLPCVLVPTATRRLASLGHPGSSIIGTQAITNVWSLTLSRTKMRYHFPRPNERRRIKRHGWFARMSTLGGRKILMRRVLKGRYVLSH